MKAMRILEPALGRPHSLMPQVFFGDRKHYRKVGICITRHYSIPIIIFSIIIVISIFLFFYLRYKRGPKKIAILQAEKNDFLESTKKPPKDIFCQECGWYIDLGTFICPHCRYDLRD